jgi:hypothetical protein
MLKGAANTLVERTTQIHPRSSIRAVLSFARTCVRTTTKQIPHKLNKQTSFTVKIYKKKNKIN